MRSIVFIHLYNDRSGSPKVLSQTIKALRNNSFKTELITSDHYDGFLTDIADQQRTLFYRRSEKKLLTLLYYIVSQLLLFMQCLRYWDKDVIFYINTMMPFGAALAGKLMGKQVYYHVHETSLKPKLLKQFLRLVISLTANKIIFVSNYLQQVERFYKKKQIIIPNAIDSDFLFSASNIMQKDKKSDIFNILMVCSLKKYKGVFEFIKIARILVNNPNIIFTLVLNAEQYEIDEYFVTVEIPSNIQIYSRQKDLDCFYSGADLLMNLSRPDEWIETFGLTIIEGMAYGLPAIVPPVGGPAEIIRDGKEGFLISSYEADAIREKILFLVNNKSEYKTLSTNTIKRVNDFNEKEFEEKICKVFEDTR